MSWKEAAALYRSHGVRELSGLLDLYFERISPRFARRGDLVMSKGHLCICRGEVIEAVNGCFPIGIADKAWRLEWEK